MIIIIYYDLLSMYHIHMTHGRASNRYICYDDDDIVGIFFFSIVANHLPFLYDIIN